LLKHDEINIFKNCWPLFVKKKANSLDFDDFWKIVSYFGLSIWTHIEYRKKVVRWHILSFLLFYINNMYTFLHKKKKQLSIEQFFKKIVRPFINIFGWKSQNSWLFFSSTGLAHFVWRFVQWHRINAQNYQT